MPVSPAQKSAIEDIIRTLEKMQAPRGKRTLCGIFMELVDREEWPEYYEVIPEPRCIDNIKAGLEKGRYKEAMDVYTDLSLVFWNALFYNEPKSQIALDAETLKNALQTEWNRRKDILPTPRTSPPPSSAQKVHGVEEEEESGDQDEPAAPNTKRLQPQQTTSSAATTTTTATQRVITAAAASTSTKMTSSTPVPTIPTTTIKPVPIRPKSSIQKKQVTPDMDVDIMSADDGVGGTGAGGGGGGDEMVVERDPESEEIVKQLEKGLPRWPGFGEQGWMGEEEDASLDRLVDIVLAIKNHKDVVGNRLASSLEAVPEESTSIPHLSYTTPLSLKLIESRARNKKYTTAKDFDKEMARLFEKARRFHEPCSEPYGHTLLLQRLYQALTSPHHPLPGPPPYVSSTHFAALRAGPGTTKPVHGGDSNTDGVAGVTTHRVLTRDRKFVEEVQYKGWTVKLADWVHLSNPDDPSRPIIAQVFRCWVSEEPAKAGQLGITVSWYYRPEQTFHPADRKFWEGEVCKTSHFADHPVEDIIEKIACQFTARHIRGRPRPPYWYLGFPLYVCDSRYNDRDRVFVKIKNWNSCIPEEVRKSTEFMPIYPFERTVYPIRYPSPFLIKGSKVKGPGGIIPSSSSSSSPLTGDNTSEADAERSKMTTRKTSGTNSGPSKGPYVGPTTTQTATPVSNAAAATTATPQTQYHYHQQQQQTTLQQQQYQSHVAQSQAVAQVYRPSGPDRSVYTAAGGAALGGNIQTEKLPPEMTKHFDRDPYTNEMLWFSAPPLNMPRAPAPKHSLEYLHFLAMKRKQQEEEAEQQEHVNDSVSNKRTRVEVRPTVRETAQKLWVEMGMDF